MKDLAKQQNTTIRATIKSCGINYDSYNSCRKYGNLPRADEAVRIAAMLGTTVEFLVTGSTSALEEDTSNSMSDNKGMTAQDCLRRINAMIKSKNTTQRILSLKCGFTERRIESLSASGRLPDAIEITKIAAALGTSVEYLVTGSSGSTAEEELSALKKTIKYFAASL